MFTVGEAAPGHQLHGAVDVRSRVAPADGPQHVLFKGLGVHRDPGDPVGAEHRQLFRRDGVRPARLHSDLLTGGTVEGGLESSEDPVHLLRRQGGGGAAPHIQGVDGFPRPAQALTGDGQLPQQGIQIGLHQLQGAAHIGRDKGAVGAPGGTEGDAHIQGDILRAQVRLGSAGGLRRLDTQAARSGETK